MGRVIVRDVLPGQVLDRLDDGLVLRCARSEDAEALAEFQGWVHYGRDRPAEGNASMTRDLMKGHMPNFAVEDWTVVEDGDNQIVSALYLISQTWSYRGIEFPVGRIELVATHPDYRRRGLVRTQMNVVHEWSRQRGELMMGITGIPWYYRRFGYEMALEQRAGRSGRLDALSDSQGGETLRRRVRPALDSDLAWIARLYQRGMQRYLLTCVRDEEMWRYDLLGRSPDATPAYQVRVLEGADGTALAVVVHKDSPDAETVVYEVDEGISFAQVNGDVFRHLRTVADGHSKNGERGDVAMILESNHPVYEAAGALLSEEVRAYAWYLRVPDLPRFLRHISPVLETRLAQSDFAGLTGSLRLNFVDRGLHITLDQGRLATIEDWVPPQHDNRLVPRVRDAMFPGLTFLQLLFGFRSVEDLEYAFPDCLISSDRARALLNVMFPLEPSYLRGIE